jgi:hypothetical protein
MDALLSAPLCAKFNARLGHRDSNILHWPVVLIALLLRDIPKVWTPKLGPLVVLPFQRRCFIIQSHNSARERCDWTATFHHPSIKLVILFHQNVSLEWSIESIMP